LDTGGSVGLGLLLSRSLLELHLAEMQHGRRRLVQTHLLWLVEPEHHERVLQQRQPVAPNLAGPQIMASPPKKVIRTLDTLWSIDSQKN